MDVWCCAPFALISLISIDKGKITAEVKNNPVMLSTLKSLSDINKHIGRRGFSLALQPITQNKAFHPGVGKKYFH